MPGVGGRPFFIQRLLQIQTASTFFFSLPFIKITGRQNWITGNPIYYLMNYPPQGVTKHFLLKEWMAIHPHFCYVIGLMIVASELTLSFFLFNPRTRRAAIVLGLLFHIMLVLTLDVPTIFLLFISGADDAVHTSPKTSQTGLGSKRRFNALCPR